MLELTFPLYKHGARQAVSLFANLPPPTQSQPETAMRSTRQSHQSRCRLGLGLIRLAYGRFVVSLKNGEKLDIFRLAEKPCAATGYGYVVKKNMPKTCISLMSKPSGGMSLVASCVSNTRLVEKNGREGGREILKWYQHYTKKKSE